MRFSLTAIGLFLLLVIAPILAQTTTAPAQTKSDVHKLSEINAYDIVAIVVMGIGLAMASAGGVGGGTIIVPLLVLVMGFDIKYATAASNFIIMGGAVANGIFNLRKRHPFVDRPLIDPDICLAMIPSMMGGAVIGAVLSKSLPSYVISILFVLLLTVSVFRTTQKGIQLHRREKAKHDNSTITTTTNHSPPTVSPQETPLVPFVQQPSSPSSSSVAVDVKDQKLQREIEQLQETERHFSWKKHLLILVSYLGIVAASIGGKLLKCGSWEYWVLLWAELPWVFGFTILFVVYMNKQRAYKVAIGFPFAAGDMEWTRKVIIWFPLGCMFAGVAAGLFGVGGAIIAGPLMLELGIVPEVASSSSALMVLYSSAAATTKFAVFDQIVWDWSILLCGMAFIVTTVAQIFILGYVRRTGRQSVIIFCIASSTGFGTVLMAYSAIKTTIKTAGQPFKVQFCNKQG